jgi:hypothetical protein
MRKTVVVVIIVLSTATSVLANHGHHVKYEICYLPSHDARVVRDYYEPRSRSLPPGLAPKGASAGQLPPGWERKVHPLPAALEQQLVVLPPDYRRGYVDGSVLVYCPRTHAVVDFVTVVATGARAAH